MNGFADENGYGSDTSLETSSWTALSRPSDRPIRLHNVFAPPTNREPNCRGWFLAVRGANLMRSDIPKVRDAHWNGKQIHQQVLET